MSDPTIASPPPKWSLITPLSTAGTNSSFTMSLLTMPSLRHQKQKFSKVKQSKSTSASLFKHLTVLRSGNSNKPEDDVETGDKEKQEKEKQRIIETDFSAGFLPRYAAGIFPGKDPAGKTGHLSGIPVRSRWALGILAGSRRDPGSHFTRVTLKNQILANIYLCSSYLIKIQLKLWCHHWLICIFYN